jgi:S1-C subfamily serine protease
VIYQGVQVEQTNLGVRVTEVSASAESAGVRVGDYVLSLDVQLITSEEDFIAARAAWQPFTRVLFRLRRDGGDVSIRVTLDAMDFGAG